jgi:hypothetical protein
LEVEKNIFSFSPADYADLRGKLHESNSAMICDYQRDYRIFSRRLRGFAQKTPEINSAVIWDCQRDSLTLFSPADHADLRRKLLKSILR